MIYLCFILTIGVLINFYTARDFLAHRKLDRILSDERFAMQKEEHQKMLADDSLRVNYEKATEVQYAALDEYREQVNNLKKSFEDLAAKNELMASEIEMHKASLAVKNNTIERLNKKIKDHGRTQDQPTA